MATTKNTKTPLTQEEIIDNYTVTYRGYVIKQKRDFGTSFHLIDGIAVNHGLVVVKNGCQAMPGCTWFQTVVQAKEAIDVLEDCGAENFWTELRKRKSIRDAAPDLLATLNIADRIIADLIDAHYGTSYHHIGDGDGLDGHDTDRILDWIETMKGPSAIARAEGRAQ